MYSANVSVREAMATGAHLQVLNQVVLLASQIIVQKAKSKMELQTVSKFLCSSNLNGPTAEALHIRQFPTRAQGL